MKISQKGFLLVAVPLVYLSGILLAEVGLINDEQRLLLNESRSKRVTALSSDLAARTLNCRTAISLYIWTKTPSDLVPFAAAEKELPESIAMLQDLIRDDQIEQKYVHDLDGLTKQLVAQCQTSISAASDKDNISSSAAVSEVDQLSHQIAEKVAAIRLREVYLAGNKPSELVVFAKKFQTFLLAAAVLGILLALGMFSFFSRHIGARLIRLRANAQRLAGEKTLLEPLAGDDEISYVDRSFHQAAQTISTTTATLRRQEEFLRTLINSMPVGVLLVTTEGDIDFANLAAERMTGFAKDELIKRQFIQLIQTEAPSIDHGGQREARLLAKAEAIPIEVHADRIQISERVNMVVAFSDIRERKQLERMRQEFVAMLTHELRSPLTSISLVLQMLSYGGYGQLEEEAAGSVEEARKTAERLLNLVGELLLYDKITVGAMELHYTSLKLPSLIEDAISEMRPIADSKKVKIEVAPDPGSASIELFADGDRLTQVLINLVHNAIKFSPAMAEVVITSRVADGVVKVEVRDSGPGIADEYLETIFDLYKQVTAQPSMTSSGLGLPICRGIIEAHGGTIGVHCNTQGGSTFWFVVPQKGSVSSKEGSSETPSISVQAET